jgi:radical SAM protein with 4Fe4S-binding SPASM domain
MAGGFPKMAEIIQAKDLRGQHRERIADAVPLSTPWTMFLEPTNTCNFRCAYCPTGDTALLKQVGRKNKLMDFDLFCKIVDDLKAFPNKLRMVNMYKDGESLIHPRFTDMVRYLRDADVTDKIWVKTNGSLLSPEYNERLVSCGLDMIGISVQHVHAQGFFDIAGVKVDYDDYRDSVLDLFRRSRGTSTKVSAKIADVGLSEEEKGRFFDDFGDRVDFISIEGLHGWSTSEVKDWKLGTNQTFDGTPRVEKIACPLVAYMLTVSSNGDISICNDDWAHYHQLGNAKTDSIMDVWIGEKLRNFRLMHLEGRRHENAACKSCDYMQALPDNIDADRELIARKIRSNASLSSMHMGS